MYILAALAHLVGEFDNQDAVLGYQPDQRHQPHLAVDVERPAGQIQPEKAARDGQRHREHDGQRIDEALELRRQHEVYERQCQNEGDVDFRAGFLELAGLASIVDLRACRDHVADDLLQLVQRLAQRGALGQRGGEGGGAELVEVVQFFRRNRLLQRHKVGKLDHRPAFRAHVDLLEVRRRQPVLTLHLHHDVVLLPFALEARHLAPAKQRLQSAPERFEVHAERGDLVAVDIHLELRLVQVKVAVEVLQQLAALPSFKDLLDISAQRLVALGGQHHELNGLIAHAQSERRRVHREGKHAGNAEHLRLEFLRDLLLRALALAPRRGFHEADALRDGREAGDDEVARDVVRLLEDCFQLAGVLVGVVNGRALRRDEHADDRPLVLVGRQFRLKLCEHDPARAGHRQPDQQDQRAGAQAQPQQRAITRGHGMDAALDNADQQVRTRLVLEHLRAHHRRERERDEPGYQHRACERPREFGKELAGLAGKKADRHIDRRQRESHGDNGKGDFSRALDGGGKRVLTIFDVAVDVLQHDDGVVDHQADGEHEGQQRQRVDRKAEQEHQRKGANKRQRDRHERDERGAHRMQEDEDDEQHEQHRLADGDVDVIERLLDEDRLVMRHLDLHPVGQRLDHARQHFAHRLRHVQRVGRRLLDDAQRDRGLAVKAHHAALIQRAKLGAANIGKAHKVAVRLLDNEVVELRRRAQIGFRQDGELAHPRLDPPGWHFHVLAAQRGLDILRRQFVGRHAQRVEPEPHGIFAFPEDAHLGDTGQRLKLVLDVPVGIIGDVQRRVLIAGEGEIDDRLGVGLDLLDDRLVDLVGQVAAHAAHPVAHIRRRGIRIAVEPEIHGDLAGFLAADRTDEIHALDSRERLLQNLRDLRLDDGRVRALVAGLHIDHGRVDVGIFAHVQPLVGHKPQQEDQQAEHRREDRTADADFRYSHEVKLPRSGPFRCADRFYICAIARLLLASHDHGFARRQPFDDLDAPVHAPANPHIGARCLAIDDAKHVSAIGRGHDRGLRHDDRILAQLRRQLDAGEQAGPQEQIRVGHSRADLNAAAVHIHHIVERENRAAEGAVRERIDTNADVQSRPKNRQKPLGHAEADFHRVGLDQAHHVGAGWDIRAGADLAEPDDTAEGRVDLGLAQASLGERQLGFVALHLCERLVPIAFRANLPAEQLLGPLEIAFCEFAGGFGLGNFGGQYFVIHRKKQIALFDRIAFREVDRLHQPVDFRADHDALLGADIADDLDLVAHGAALGGRDFDRNGVLRTCGCRANVQQ